MEFSVLFKGFLSLKRTEKKHDFFSVVFHLEVCLYQLKKKKEISGVANIFKPAASSF